MKWPFTWGRKKALTPFTPSVQQPLFPQPKGLLSTKNSDARESSQSVRLLCLLTGPVPHLSLMWGRAVPGTVWVIRLYWVLTFSRLHLRKISRPQMVISSRLLLYVPHLAWNLSSTLVVSPCESRWLQRSEKCLEFANPGLWASSCLAFFFLAWYLQRNVVDVKLGSRVHPAEAVLWPQNWFSLAKFHINLGFY